MMLATRRRSSTLADRTSTRRRHAVQLESLESRTLLTALYVTPPSTPADATHFQTLQAALSMAASGDTIILQPGLSAGAFGTSTLGGTATAGSTFLFTTSSLEVNEIVTIGDGSSGDPFERALVTSVTQMLGGSFIATVDTPTQFDHDSSPINASNPSSTGPTLGINKSVTITTDGDADLTLPYNLEIWGGTSGVTISSHIFTPANPKPVTPTDPVPATETINVTASNLTVVQGGYICRSLAHFTDSLHHRASDFTATVTFADGSVVKGFVFRTRSGSFEVLGPHKMTLAGDATFTVSVTSKSGGMGSGAGSVDVMPRVLAAQGLSLTTNSNNLQCANVATFTDNLRCGWASIYKATIVWSDGVTTTGVICRACNGMLTVKTSRSLSGPGTLTGAITVSTKDGAFSTTATCTLTVNAAAQKSTSLFHSGGTR